jgi:hypothetical protein
VKEKQMQTKKALPSYTGKVENYLQGVGILVSVKKTTGDSVSGEVLKLLA